MKVRELIAALAQEDDMDSTVYVRIDHDGGGCSMSPIDGIAQEGRSFRPTNKSAVCTTLEIMED